MKKSAIVLFVLNLIILNRAFSQQRVINASVYDEKNQNVYNGGVIYFNVKEIYGIEVLNKNFTSKPIVSLGIDANYNNKSHINALALHKSTLYAGGAFKGITDIKNNIQYNFTSLIKIDTTLNQVINWQFPDSVEITTLTIYNDFLYAGVKNGFGYKINLLNDSISIVNIFDSNKILIKDDQIFSLTNNFDAVEIFNIDTNKDPTPIDTIFFPYQLINNFDVDTKSGLIYCAGNFISDNKTTPAIAIDYKSKTRYGNWGENLTNITGIINYNNGLKLNPPSHIESYSEFATSIKIWGDQVIVGGLFWNNVFKDFVITGKYKDDSLYSFTYNNISPSIPLCRPNSIELTNDNKLLFVGHYSLSGNSWIENPFLICIPPIQPTTTYASSIDVCAGDTAKTIFISSVLSASSYSWTYSGTGISIIANDTVAKLKVNKNATPGNIIVTAIKNSCGPTLKSIPTYIPIHINPAPIVNAGTDKTLNCDIKTVTLSGTASNNVLYNWSGPQFSGIATGTSITADKGGNYVLKVTDNTTGCINTDTVSVYMDTIPPKVYPPNKISTITCKDTTCTLDASFGTPKTQLFWDWPNKGAGIPDPITVKDPNVYYTLYGINSINGCKSKPIPVLVPGDIKEPLVTLKKYSDTLTCSKKSLQLVAICDSAATYVWQKKGTPGFNSTNPATINSGGTYNVIVTADRNGCKTTKTAFVTYDTLKPNVNFPKGNFNLNCSRTSVLIDASGVNPHSSLMWSGANNFSSTNPALIPALGTYTLNVTDSANGCSNKNSYTIDFDSTLIIDAGIGKVICKNTNASLKSVIQGGTPPFVYNWKTNNTIIGMNDTITVAPDTLTAYYIYVSDNAGCKGKDSVYISIDPPIKDSITVFQPCDPNLAKGQVQHHASGGNGEFSYSIDGAIQQVSPLFTGLAFGTYTFVVTDNIGCSITVSATIDNKSLKPVPDFILSTSTMKQDTFVLVDISNPRPDSIEWFFPAGVTMIDSSDLFNPVVVYHDTGMVTIRYHAWISGCEFTITKKVHVAPFDQNAFNKASNNRIAEINIGPNPNSGHFNIDVKLYKKQTFAVFVYNPFGIEVMRIPFTDSDHETATITLPLVTNGTYILKVIAEYDSKQKGFIVIQ